MEYIKWESLPKVGIEEIDNQHHRLINLINKFYEANSTGRSDLVIKEVFRELDNYIKYHFNTEEKYFYKFNYPETGPHKHEHNQFVTRINNFYREHRDRNATVSSDMFIYLKEWFSRHIIQNDMLYVRFFKEHGVK